MNKPMSAQRARERALFLYSNALDRGDFDAVSRILKQAERDPLLERMMADLDAQAELPIEQPEATTRIVRKSGGVEQIITIRRPSPDGQTPESNHFEEDKNMITSAAQEFEQYYPRPRTTTSGMRWLTLIAAVLVVVIMGLLTVIIFRAGFVGNPLLLGGQVEPTPTPIPTPQGITKDNTDQLELLQVLGYGVVYRIDWTADGSTITLLTDKNYIAQFNPDALDKLPRFIQPATEPGQAVMYADFALSPDATLLAISQGPTISLYDRESDSERDSIQQFGIDLLTFSPDGMVLAGASRVRKAIYIWDAATGKEINQMRDGDTFVNALAYNPDGTLLAVGYGDKKVRLWEVGTGKLLATLTGHTNEVMGVMFREEGKSIASVDKDGRVLLWDWKAATGTQRITLRRRSEKVNWAVFSTDGNLLATAGDDHTIRLVDMSDGTEKYTLTGHTDVVKKLAFSPDGNRLASYGADETLRLWDVASGMQIGEVEIARGHISNLYTLALISPDGKTLASASDDGLGRLWDVATGTVKSVLKGHVGEIFHLAFAPDGQTLASTGADPLIRLWDVATGDLKAEFRGHATGISSAVFSPDGRQLASSGDDQTVRLWDVASGESQVIEGDGLFGLTYSADGNTLIFPGLDGHVRLWDLSTNSERMPPKPSPISYGGFMNSPIGNLVTFSGLEGQVWLWDFATGEARALVGHTRDEGGFSSAGFFSPDGKLLVSGATDDTFRLWDVDTGTQLSLYNSQFNVYGYTAFSPDGTKVIVGIYNGAIELWGLPPTGG